MPLTNKDVLAAGRSFVRKPTIFAAMVLVLVTGLVIFNQTSSPSPSAKNSVVMNVVDGDTFDVLLDGETKRVRMIGVDTPEVVDPRKPVQCFGKEASERAKQALLGKEVRLEADPSQDDKDRYGRLLRYVYLLDDTNVNLLLVREGFAHEYTYAIPYALQAEFKEAERAARMEKAGLWADRACESLPI